jgi:hypothetical protein
MASAIKGAKFGILFESEQIPVAPEGEFVAQPLAGLERRIMAEEPPCAATFDAAGFGCQQPGEQAQQARFAAAVGAFDGQRATGFDAKGDAAEQQAIAAPAGKIGGDKGFGRHAADARRSWPGIEADLAALPCPPKSR